MPKIHRYIALVFTFVFVLFAAFQYNDPDAALWIGIYGMAALASFFAYYRPLHRFTYLITALGYLAGAIILWPPQYEGITRSMSGSINIEEARESLGLLICAVVMGYYFFVTKKKRVK